MKKKKNKFFIMTIIFDFLVAIFLFFTYGPVSYFRNLLVTTAMTTKEHRYIAKTLYSEKMINKILKANYVNEIEENTDTSVIDFSKIKEKDKYESIYEEQILKRDKDELYKIIDLKGKNYKGYLVAIYDPSKIKLIKSKYFGKRGQFLQNMAEEHNALVAINAGGFEDAGGVGNGGISTGVLIENGKIIYRGGKTGFTGGIIGFNNNNVLVLTKEAPEIAIKNGLRDGVEFGPFLIVNGKNSYVKGNGGWGISSRTAIGQRKDGIVLFIIIDGRQPGYSLGADMNEIIKIFERYKAYNAANLDGGASTSLVVNGKTISKPCAVSATGERWIPNAWMLIN